MKKFYLFLSFLFLFISTFTLYNIIFINHNYYEQEYKEKTSIYVSSLSRPRGRIIDCKGNVLVDNVGVKAIVYRKVNGISLEEEISVAYKLAGILDITDTISLLDLKKFWLVTHPKEGDNLITEEEYTLYDQRKLNKEDLYTLKLERITDMMLDIYNELDKKCAYFYTLMNKGYYYDAKVMKLEVSEKEYARVLEEKLKGITNEMYFKREYPYGATLKSIFGSVGAIPKDKEREYVEKGYQLDDIVGISYLEEEYDEYLKGEKDTYEVNSDGTLTLVKEGKRGNDIVLSIDINMQLGIESIVKEEIKKGKKLKNTEHYQGSYVLVSEPLSGAIKAIVALKYIKEDVFKNVENEVISLSFTAGSVVKGASMAMAYQNNLVELDKKIKDACVKLYLVPEKCSYKSLGYIDDITALKTSSNYYQFLLAIKLAGYKYSSNLKMEVSEKEFNIYRDVFKQFGLGAKTEIDLPNEQIGIKGTKISPDLLLNFAIGQYDTYTPVGLLQYINTIASSGKRYRLSLLDKVITKDGSVLVTQDKKILSTFQLEEDYFKRIQTGFREVISHGTGYGYVDTKYNAAGKTGTSETFYDSNLDGIGDIKTISNTFAMYAPPHNPKYSIVSISPNVSHHNGNTNYFAYINRYISKSVSDYVLGNY